MEKHVSHIFEWGSAYSDLIRVWDVSTMLKSIQGHFGNEHHCIQCGHSDFQRCDRIFINMARTRAGLPCP
eukprot:349759-Amphidinium_carterae.2